MRLEPIGELRLAYGAEGFTRIRPYGTDEGSGWGEGDGTIRGDHLSGTVLWANAPHVRSDNTFMPHAHGRIQTDDGVTILFLMEGRTPGSGEEEGRQLLRLMFECDDPRYDWVNTAFVVAEGLFARSSRARNGTPWSPTSSDASTSSRPEVDDIEPYTPSVRGSARG